MASVLPTMTSADFCNIPPPSLYSFGYFFNIRSYLRQLCYRSLRVSISAFGSCSHCIYAVPFCTVIGLLFLWQHHPQYPALICTSCSLAQTFAASFFQIRSRPRHPCFWLILLTVKRIRDLHPIADTHA